jgi:hypothetical protein
MSEKLGLLPKEKNMRREFEGEYVATSRPKRDEVKGDWRKLHGKEVHYLFSSAKYYQRNEI